MHFRFRSAAYSRLGTLAFGLAFCLSLQASEVATQAPAFDPRSFRPKVAGAETEILVIGTAHLSSIEGITLEKIEPLLEKLATFKPDLITIEALSGESLHQLEFYSSLYRDAATDYGKRIVALSKPAEAASGLTRAQAALKVRTTLGQWPAAPTAQDRRQLCLYFAASGDPTSALVQWLHLALTERTATNGITPEIAGLLDAMMDQPNENNLIAAQLAARLGHERVYPVDDHSADDAGEDMPAALVNATNDEVAAADAKAGRNYSNAYRAMIAQVQASQTDVLSLYRFLNLPENQRLDAEEQWGSMLSYESKHHLTRAYVGWWETRNLRMVANIREAISSYPGKRALVIVGASHKPYFDAYLDLIPEVKLADAEAILK